MPTSDDSVRASNYRQFLREFAIFAAVYWLIGHICRSAFGWQSDGWFSALTFGFVMSIGYLFRGRWK